MALTTQVFEYGHVCSINNKHIPNHVISITERAYLYLRRLSLCEEAEAKLLRLKSVDGVEAIQFLNFVGVLVTPDGMHIEILPKVTKHDEHENALEDSRLALLNMLKTLGLFRHIQTEMASLKQQKMPLLEIFISQFLASVNKLVKRGVKHDYQTAHDNLFYLKGKLNVSEQLKRNLVHQDRFVVDYDDYVSDIYANRLIKTALQKVLIMTQSAAHQRLARELEFVFADVAKLEQRAINSAKVTIARGMEHYKSPVTWSEIILRGMSPLSMQGDANAFSLLFPLDAVFESYVEQVLRTTLTGRLSVRGQLQTAHLVNYDAKRMFKLKPDIAVFDGNTMLLVMDTKWKLIDASKANGTDKFMLSQSDFYQMFAYGQKYLGGVGELVLIYPANKKFQQPLAKPFEFSDSLRLWVVPFDIHHQTSDSIRLRLPVQLEHLIN
ncbi:MAG: McrC family protein [Paraglaciecola sp.]|nr:McrC family protein [Paraglaciecola sp.]